MTEDGQGGEILIYEQEDGINQDKLQANVSNSVGMSVYTPVHSTWLVRYIKMFYCNDKV